MKRLSLAILLLCCSLALAQDIRVNYQGKSPSISDFAWALLSSTANDDEEDCSDESMNALKQAWIQNRNGKPQESGTTLTIDQKNGYAVYESKDGEHLLRIEMCYWNEADKKHNLFAYNIVSFKNGKYEPGQFDGLSFYRYDNASKKMTLTADVGFERIYGTDGGWISYELPRSGKDITMNTWYEKEKKQNTLKWDGRRFKLQ